MSPILKLVDRVGTEIGNALFWFLPLALGGLVLLTAFFVVCLTIDWLAR